MPRRSASVMIGFGQSWCMVTTSMPWSARLSVVEVILAGSHQLPVNTTVVVAAGFTDLAPSSKAFTFSSVWGIGNAATKPSLPVLLTLAAVAPDRYTICQMLPKKVARLLKVLGPPLFMKVTFGYFLATWVAGSKCP